MRTYAEYLKRKQSEYGEQFDPANLAPKFVRFYESGERIKVRTPGGGVQFGTVSVTAGRKPSFMLMRNSRARGSSTLLDGTYTLLAVKRGRYYREAF